MQREKNASNEPKPEPKEPSIDGEVTLEGNEQVDEQGRIVSVDAKPFIPGVQPMIPLNSTMTVYGKRRSGKSVFLRWFTFLYLRNFIPWFYCFTHTKHNLFFEGFMAASYVIPVFSADILHKIMARQETAINIYLSQRPDTPQPFNPRVCVFWDDYNGKVRNNSLWCSW